MPFLLTTHSISFALNFSLRVQTNYTLALMFFFHIATAFPTSYRIKTVLVEFENSAVMHSHSTQDWKFGKFRETIHCYCVSTPCRNDETNFISLSRYWRKRHINDSN